MIDELLPPTPEERRLLDAASTHIRARVIAAVQYRVAVRPQPGSEHELALQGWRGNEPGALAELLLVSAEFHFLTLASTLSSRELYPLGGYTLIRGAAEPSARAAWLMDPNVGPKVRRARVLAERLNALIERRKFKDQRRKAADRIKELIADAEDLGHQVDDRNRPTHFGQARTSATTLFGQLLPGVASRDADPVGADLYRILSGFTHSVPWALLAQAETFQGESPGHKWARIELRPKWLLGLLDQALTIHDIAQRRLAAQIGQGSEAWDALLTTIPERPDPQPLFER